MTVTVCILCLLSLVGCAKCIGVEGATVEVKVVDERYTSEYVTFMYINKTMFPQTHPAVYRITVEYNGIEYSISGRETYEKYKNSIGEYVNGILETKTYDDGTVRYDILSLE